MGKKTPEPSDSSKPIVRVRALKMSRGGATCETRRAAAQSPSSTCSPKSNPSRSAGRQENG